VVVVAAGGLGAALVTVTVPFVDFEGAALTLLELEAFDELELELELAGLDDELGGMTLKLYLAPHCAKVWPFLQHVVSAQ